MQNAATSPTGGWIYRDVLEDIVRGEGLSHVLDRLCLLVEQIDSDVVCSVMLLNEDGRSLYVAAAPNAPIELREALNGLKISENAGSCGSAAFTGRPALVENTTTDPRWTDIRDTADAFNIRACWSYPILSVGERKTLGTFAISHAHPAVPDDDDRRVLESAAHLAGIAIEISNRKRAAEEVHDIDLAMRNAIPGIARLDQNDRYVMIQDKYAEILGYQVSEMMGMHVSKTIFPEDMPISLGAFEELKKEGRAEVEVRGLRKDGSTFIKRCLLVNVDNPDGESIGYYCFMDDVTDRRQAERDKAELQEQLRQSQKLESIGTLAGGIAHDFNNLLTAINGYAELARESLPLGHPARQSMEIIESTAHQASDVTRSLLTFARETRSEMKQINLIEVIDHSIDLLRRLLPASVEVDNQARAMEPVWIRGDATQIQQVLMNLAINARDAMSHGGKLEIQVLLKHPGDICRAADRVLESEEAAICVRDNGDGMTPEVASRVFEPFFTTKAREKGTGLGLSVVHGIVANHDGVIGLESEPGGGTTVYICLPICDAPAPPIADDKESDANEDGEMILLAEDNTLIGDLMVRALETSGYRTCLVKDGQQAIDSFQKFGHDVRLVVLDIDLPKRTGFECADEIHEVAPSVPIVIISGNVLPITGRDDRANEHFLPKPFSMSELLTVVESLAGRSTSDLAV